MQYRKTLEGKVATRITRKSTPVFVREDFLDLAGYDQVGRALKALTRSGRLIRIGYGLYAKSRPSRLTGKPILTESLPILARKALDRLGVRTLPSRAELAYADGRSTQVPTGRLIGVQGRIQRKIGYQNAEIYYERGRTNA